MQSERGDAIKRSASKSMIFLGNLSGVVSWISQATVGMQDAAKIWANSKPKFSLERYLPPISILVLPHNVIVF